MSQNLHADIIDNEGVSCEVRPYCALCKTRGEPLYDTLRDHEFGAPGTWSLKVCTNRACGLVWLNPRPRTSDLHKLYNNYYTHSAAVTTTEENPYRHRAGSALKAGVKGFLASILFWRRLSFQGDKGYLGDTVLGRLLDVGCGSGGFLARMASLGWVAHGIDFDEQALRVAAQRRGVTVFQGDLLSHKFNAGSYDAIHLGNVIEHLPDPVEVCTECYRILAPGGRLIMITPNTASIGHRIFGADWRGLEPPRHLQIFNPASLRTLARLGGFKSTSVFTVSGDKPSASYVVDSSVKNAGLNGRLVNKPNVNLHMFKQRMFDLVGALRGDWVVLIASK